MIGVISYSLDVYYMWVVNQIEMRLVRIRVKKMNRNI